MSDASKIKVVSDVGAVENLAVNHFSAFHLLLLSAVQQQCEVLSVVLFTLSGVVFKFGFNCTCSIFANARTVSL